VQRRHAAREKKEKKEKKKEKKHEKWLDKNTFKKKSALKVSVRVLGSTSFMEQSTMVVMLNCSGLNPQLLCIQRN
jgi:hypothetical protein